MAEASLRLEIVTPKGVALSEEVDELVAPGARGEFGVLPGHLPMLAALSIGLVHYKKKHDGDMVDVAVGNGFVEVIGDKALVLTDRFITKDEVRVLEVRERLKEVDGELERWQGDLDDPARLELIEEEQWLAAQLEVYGDPPVARVLEQRRAADYSGLLELLPPAEPLSSESGEATEAQPEGGEVDEERH